MEFFYTYIIIVHICIYRYNYVFDSYKFHISGNGKSLLFIYVLYIGHRNTCCPFLVSTKMAPDRIWHFLSSGLCLYGAGPEITSQPRLEIMLQTLAKSGMGKYNFLWGATKKRPLFFQYTYSWRREWREAVVELPVWCLRSWHHSGQDWQH